MLVQTVPTAEVENLSADVWTKMLEARASRILGVPSFAPAKPFEMDVVPARPRAPKSRKANVSKPSPIRSLPPEIFINMCKFLQPKDLASLGSVCKLYREWLLSPNSTTTQNIWRRSRQSFLRQLSLPPPVGMDELSYIKLALSKGCQFCDNKTRTVYWAFRVRCCKSCLREYTMNEAQANAMNIPRDVLSGLPFGMTSSDGCGFSRKIYWRDNVIARVNEHQRLPLDERAALVRKHVAAANTVMADVEQRKTVEQDARRVRREEKQSHVSQRMDALNKRIRDMCSQTDCTFIEKALYATETYISTTALENAFTDRSWQILKKRLLADYKLMEERHAKAQAELIKQRQIIQHIETLTTEGNLAAVLPAGPTMIGLPDLLCFLAECPSFKHPPGLPRRSYDTPYDGDYLDGVFVPQLQREAWQQIAHLVDASEASVSGFAHSAIFTCVCCGTGELCRYYSVLQHVQTVHKIRDVERSEKLIAVDRDTLVNLCKSEPLEVATWDKLRKKLHKCGFCED